MNAVFEKLKSNAELFGDLLPQSFMRQDGTYVLGTGGNWIDGFYVGTLNIAYLLSGENVFREYAKQYRDFYKLRIQNTPEINTAHKFLPLDHDVGMIFLPSIGFDYTMDGDEESASILQKAADVLVDRFNSKGNFIRAWDTWAWDKDPSYIEEKRGKAIIDSMLNIPLLFKVAEITGNRTYYDVGLRHAHTMADYIVRTDGSTYHTFNFNPDTGAPIGGKTAQGYSDESCWSRGQAWAVYGFALAYKYTKDKRFLDVSKKTANYFMEHLNALDLPCWDFDVAQKPFAPWDSAAAIICASGLLELYAFTQDEMNYTWALRLIHAVERFCLTVDYAKCQPLIIHGCSGPVFQKDQPELLKNMAIGQALVYPDYFYLECKLKLSTCKVRIF